MAETMQGKGYGCLPSIDSIRVYDYANLPKKKLGLAPENVAEYKIPEDRMPRVLDQGSIGACVAHAICSVLESIHYTQTGEWIKLSPGWFYGHNRGEWSNGYGMVTSSAVEMSKQWGSVETTMFNDYMEMPEMKKVVQARPDLEAYAEETAITSFVKFNWANKNKKWNEIKEAFLSYNLPMIAVSPSYFGESHCIMIYGFNENGKGGKELYFQNSWGESYSSDGRSNIPFSRVSEVYLLLDEEISLQFDDVPEDAWYYKNVLHMYEAGLVNGKEDNKFEPDAPITRAEVCAIIDRLCEKIDNKDDAMIKSIYDYVDRRNNIRR